MPSQAPVKPKKPLYFPLTRSLSPIKQYCLLAIYSLFLLILFAGCYLYLRLRPPNQSFYFFLVQPGEAVDLLQVFLFLFFSFLVLPVTTLLSGALFGSGRAFLIVSFVLIGTAGIILYSTNMPITGRDIPLGMVYLLIFSGAAELVGFFYERRRFAAWWKSLLIFLLGATGIAASLTILIFIQASPRNATPDELLTFYLSTIGLGLIFIIGMTFPVAGIEGLLHAIIAARHQKQRRHVASGFPI
ncbi:MAG TPA: hypothetical protein VFN35_32415 [Ktedonobacteraceae bacterium]|nr:hypothetical protein [Ktedonobacteraceae bacterium]